MLQPARRGFTVSSIIEQREYTILSGRRAPFACEDLTIAGVLHPRGEMILGVIGSANRDEQQFADPDSLQLTREPNGPWPSARAPITVEVRRSPDWRVW